MAATLKLTRPLVCLDLETTGLRPKEDRIVELAIVTLLPDGGRETTAWRINPGCPIPAAASAVHGITDADVVASPDFASLAAKLAGALAGCDLAGYNIERFDLPMLQAEFARVGISFPQGACRVVDACTIFMRKEPRDLTAALQRFCGRVLEGAHGAAADATATLDVLLAQVGHYEDLGDTLEALDAFCHPDRGDYLDAAGKLVWREGVAVLNFGKHRGRPLAEMAAQEPGYLQWLAKGDFPSDTRALARDALAGSLPTPPGGPGGSPTATATAPRPTAEAAGPAIVPAIPPPPQPSAGPRQASLWPEA